MHFGYNLNDFYNAFNNDFQEITVQIGDSPQPPILARLVLSAKLSTIRFVLENDGIIDDTLSFSRKIKKNDNSNNEIDIENYKFTEIVRQEEEIFRLSEIIDESHNILYLIESSKPNWRFLNNKCKLDYGCTMTDDGIKKAENRAFIMKDCELIEIGAEGYRNDKVEFNPNEIEDWIMKTNLFFTVDEEVKKFVKLGSIGTSGSDNFRTETNLFINHGRSSLKFSKYLEPAEGFIIAVEDAIISGDPENFIRITEKFGQFIPTEVILGGRVYFEDDDDNGKLTNYKKLIGGQQPDRLEDFNKEAWVKTLDNYRNWDCIEFQNPISIFRLLPDDLQKQIFLSVGKKILYSIIEDFDFKLNGDDKPVIFELNNIPSHISKIIQNKDADCNVFATVINTKKTKDFFSCQILCPSDGKPSLIIHCIQKEFNKYDEYKLKIGWMVVGYYTDFNFTPSDFNVQLEVLRNDFNASDHQTMINTNLLNLEYEKVSSCIGIPVLNKLDSSNDSLIIGHHFFNTQESGIGLRTFSYCLKNNRYVNLPTLTFCTLIILNYPISSAFGTIPFELNKRSIHFEESLMPKYVGLFFTGENYYGPLFLNQTINKIKIKCLNCYCEKRNYCICKINTLEIPENNIECAFFNPYISYDDYCYDGSVGINATAGRLSQNYTSTPISNTTETTIKAKSINDKRDAIQFLKLNHGLLLDGYKIRPSKQALFTEDNGWNISLCKEQPIGYTNINDSSDICINFPIAEITYEADRLKSFPKYVKNELYGHFFARRITVGGKLFIKEFSSATQTQIDILKFYLFCAYNSAKYSIEIQFNNLFTMDLLPKIETLDGEDLNTYEKLIGWMNSLYQMETIDIISYGDLIPISHSTSDLETFNEKQPGITDFKEKLRLEDWVGDAAYGNLISWTIDFHLFKGLLANKNYKIENSKKIAVDFIEIPQVNLSDNSYLEMIRPSTISRAILISHNIFSIKNLSSFPLIQSDFESYGDYHHILVKCEQYEILLNRDNMRPTKEFEQTIEKALNSMKPLKALQDVFNEYGHLFPQRIILGRSLKVILPNSTSSNTFYNVNLKSPIFESLKPHLDNLSISYLLTQKGKSIERNDLHNWIYDTNDNLEIVAFDNIIPLYKILEVEQQRKIHNILNDFNDLRIIMTGVTDLEDIDVDDNNVEYYKRINVETSLEDENYEVIGSIVSESSLKLDNVFVNFGLYDFNGFYAIIKKLETARISIKDCCVLWIIIGRPSQLSVLSPKNQDIQVKYFKRSIKLQPNQVNYYIETLFPLSQGYTVFIHAYYSPTNYEPKNIIKLVEWSYSSINFQITDISQLNIEKPITINLHICVLCSDYKNLKIDNMIDGINEGECTLDLIGFILTKENWNGKLLNEIDKAQDIIKQPFTDSIQAVLSKATQLHEANIFGGSSKFSSHCIIYNLPKETVLSILESISKKTTSLKHETPIYILSTDWISSLTSSTAHELSKTFNAPAEGFAETGRTVANIISSVGNGTWSAGITPVNAIRDIETNFPLYISDYFDQLSGWSREHVFEREKARIGSNIAELQSFRNPYCTPKGFSGSESAISGKFVKISWKLPIIDIRRPFNTDSNNPTFISKGEPSSGEVYRYFAFIDNYKQAISMNKDGSITKELYNFIDSSQLWRIDNYGTFYALYNKKYKKYLGRTLIYTDIIPCNNWDESAVYIVENIESFTYSIGFTYNNMEIEYPPILKDLTLVTIPVVAWRNSSGQFLNLDHGALSFSNGEHDNVIIPKSEQLFLFVPHPDFSNKAVVIGHNGKFLGFNPSISNNVSCDYDLKTPEKLPFILFEYDQNIWPRSANYLASRLQQPLIAAAAAKPPRKGMRARIWKANPFVKKIVTRELYLTNTDVETGPKDSWFDTVSTTQPIAPDANGDFLLDFERTPTRIPESDNHVQFDVIHTFSVVRYVYDLLIADLEYLDGSPPVLYRPWGKNKRLSIYPHAGEMANAFYSRDEAALKFFFIKQKNGSPVYLCRSLDIVAHETSRSFLDLLQPQWLTNSGQAGAFHEAFGDLNSLFVLISLADIADLFITTTKANLRAIENFIAAIGGEFGDALYDIRGKGPKNLSNTYKGSGVEPEAHVLSLVFCGFYYDVLVDVFELERNSSTKSDTETLMDVGRNLRRALIIAIRVSSDSPIRTKFREIATNLDTAIGTLGRRLGIDLASWRQIVRKHTKERELSIAGFGKNTSITKF